MPSDDDGPAHVSLLLAFANSLDVHDGTDGLDSPAALAGWLAEHKLAAAGTRATDADLASALRLRSALRALLLGEHEHTADAGSDAELTAAAEPYPLRLSVRDGAPAVAPARPGVPGGVGAVVAAIIAARADGVLPRVKICAEDTCQVAFVDASKNRSRQWCSMRTCGNRAKTRSYRARRRDLPPGGPGGDRS